MEPNDSITAGKADHADMAIHHGPGEPLETNIKKDKPPVPARPEPPKPRPPRPAPPKTRPPRPDPPKPRPPKLEPPQARPSRQESGKDFARGRGRNRPGTYFQPQADNDIAAMIIEGLAEKKESCSQLRILESSGKDERIKDLLRTLYMDEYKHCLLLENIYLYLTGNNAEARANIQSTALRGKNPLERLLFQKFDNVNFYKRLMFSFIDQDIRDMIFEIIADEQINAVKLNYLLTLTSI